MYHWDAIVALLRTGTKLDLPLLRNAAIEYLSSLFPCDLENVNSDYRLVTARPDETKRVLEIEAVNLAREYDIPCIMPMACYSAAQLSIQKLLGGFTWSDGTHEKLGDEDLARVLCGREHLLLSRRHTVYHYLNNFTQTGKATPPSRDCVERPRPRGDTCFFFLLRMQIDFNSSGFHEMDARGLEVLPPLSLELIRPQLCDSCWKLFEEEMHLGRKLNWDRLPSYFDLRDWEDVKKRHVEASESWN